MPGIIANDKDFEAAKQLEDGDPNDSREERAFRMWINSLNLDFQINNLYEDCKDGLLLLRILEKILGPGRVDWKKAVLQPKHKL